MTLDEIVSALRSARACCSPREVAAVEALLSDEREVCARLAEAPAVTGEANDWVQSTAFSIAAAIRSRGASAASGA